MQCSCPDVNFVVVVDVLIIFVIVVNKTNKSFWQIKRILQYRFNVTQYRFNVTQWVTAKIEIKFIPLFFIIFLARI